MVSSMYNKAVQIVKSTLANVMHISLSVDCCTLTNSSKGYLVVTAHFIGKEVLLFFLISIAKPRLHVFYTKFIRRFSEVPIDSYLL